MSKKEKHIIRLTDELEIKTSAENKRIILSEFADYYEKKTGKKIEIDISDLDSIENQIEDKLMNDNKIFKDFMLYSIRKITSKVIYNLNQALDSLSKESFDDMDKKTVFVIFDKMIEQVKTLTELYDKISVKLDGDKIDNDDNLFNIKKIV
ncbi:MAG: hypothetical protein QXF12_01650 [Candidatus Aenigmatarchaeota archaeon]